MGLQCYPGVSPCVGAVDDLHDYVLFHLKFSGTRVRKILQATPAAPCNVLLLVPLRSHSWSARCFSQNLRVWCATEHCVHKSISANSLFAMCSEKSNQRSKVGDRRCTKNARNIMCHDCGEHMFCHFPTSVKMHPQGRTHNRLN